MINIINIINIIINSNNNNIIFNIIVLVFINFLILRVYLPTSYDYYL